MSDDTPSPLNNVIAIDDERIKSHLDRVVRGTVEESLNALLDAEADRLCNAQRYERSEARRDTRAGHYERNLQTKAGEVRLKIPKLSQQTFETAIIERYRRRESSVEEALIEMYLAGVSVLSYAVESVRRRRGSASRPQLFFSGDTGETVAGLPSQRTGIEFTNDYRPTPWMHIDADLALTRARFIGFDYAQAALYQSLAGYPQAQIGNAPGKLIYNAPWMVASAGIALGNATGWFGDLRWRCISSRPLTGGDGEICSLAISHGGSPRRSRSCQIYCWAWKPTVALHCRTVRPSGTIRKPSRLPQKAGRLCAATSARPRQGAAG